MYYSHSRPSITWTVSAGTIITDPTRLTNGRPGSVTRFTWPAGAQTTSTTMALEGVFDKACSPGLVGLRNVSLPVGTLVKIQADFGAGYVNIAAPNQSRVFARPNGEKVLWIVLPTGLASASALQFVIYNDVNGAVSIVASSEFTIGEAWVGPGLDLGIQNNWSFAPDDSTKTTWSRDQQPSTRKGTTRRVLTWTPAMVKELAMFGDPANPSAIDMELLIGKMALDTPVVCVPRTLDAAGAYSDYLVNRTAVFGIATKKSLPKHAAGPWYQGNDITLSEAGTTGL